MNIKLQITNCNLPINLLIRYPHWLNLFLQNHFHCLEEHTKMQSSHSLPVNVLIYYFMTYDLEHKFKLTLSGWARTYNSHYLFS